MPTSSGTVVKNRKEDSYLRRYFKTLPEEKRKMIEESLMSEDNGQAHVCHLEEAHVDVPSQAPDKGKDNVQHRNRADGDVSEERETSPKKSSTCIVL